MDKIILGKRIRYLRHTHNISQRTPGNIVGIGTAAVNEWEKAADNNTQQVILTITLNNLQ